MTMNVTGSIIVSTIPSPTSTIISSSSHGNYFCFPNSTATSTTPSVYLSSNSSNYIVTSSSQQLAGNTTIAPGYEITLELPDGAVLDIKKDGSYTIIDTDAKITYKANNIREFNRYLNGSDLLEMFIDFVAQETKCSKKEFLQLPIELFIQWLVIRAAEADGEDVDYTPVKLLLPAKVIPRCKCCGRYIVRKKQEMGLPFCSVEHVAKFATKHSLF